MDCLQSHCWVTAHALHLSLDGQGGEGGSEGLNKVKSTGGSCSILALSKMRGLALLNMCLQFLNGKLSSNTHMINMALQLGLSLKFKITPEKGLQVTKLATGHLQYVHKVPVTS